MVLFFEFKLMTLNRFFISILLFASVIKLHAQCGLSSASLPVTITDTDNDGADTTNIPIVVSGALNNNLASPVQGLCAVKIKYRHPFAKELHVELISPSGQRIRLIGGDVIRYSTPLITWDIVFVRCKDQANPDDGILSKWDNNQDWESLKTYSGQYYPNSGCLEDFNSGTVNGTWTLRLIDFEDLDEARILGAELVFCDSRGINCFDCKSDPGEILNGDTTLCQNDAALALPLNKVFKGAQAVNSYEYNNVIFKNNTIVTYQKNIDLRSFSSGTYTICPVQLSKLESLPSIGSTFSPGALQLYFKNRGACAFVSDSCLVVQVLDSIPAINRVKYICKGESYELGQDNFSQAGKYQVRIENGVCDSTILLDLKVIDLNTQIIADRDSISCIGNINKLQTRHLGSNGLTIKYQWFTTDGQLQGNTTLPVAETTKDGTYFLAAESSNAQYTCRDTFTKVIYKDLSFLNFKLTTDTLSCLKNVVEIKHTFSKPVVSKSWVTKDGMIQNVTNTGVNVTKQGWYYITATGIDGCSATDSIYVAENKSFVNPEIFADSINCKKSVATIRLIPQDTTQPYTYRWANVGPTYINSKVVPVTAAGIYTVTVTNIINGCNKSFNAVVKQDFSPPAIFVKSDTISCNRAGVTPVVITTHQAASYKWIGNSFFSNASSPVITDPGSYYVEFTSADNGCKATYTFTVDKDTILPKLQIPDKELSCANQKVKLTVSSNRTLRSVSWTGPFNFVSNELEPEVNKVGTYAMDYVSDNGCVGTEKVLVTYSSDIPQVIVQVDSLKCGADTARVRISNSKPNYIYAWSGNGLLAKNIAQPGIVLPGSFTVTVTDKDSGCFNVYNIDVHDDRIYSKPDISVEELNCKKDSIKIELKNPDIAVIKYTGPTGFSSDSVAPFVKKAGWYKFTYLNTKNCKTSDSIQVIRNDTIPVLTKSFSFFGCSQDSVSISVFSSIPNTQCTWKGPDGFNKTGTDIYVYKGGRYTAEGLAPNGCKSELVTIDVGYDTIPTPFSITTPDTITCNRQSVMLKIAQNLPGVTFNWLPGNMEGTQISVSSPGDYIAEGKSNNGCKFRDTVTVIEGRKFPLYDASATTINCKDLLSEIIISPKNNADTLTWLSQLNPIFIPAGSLKYKTSFPGDYQFILKNKDGCETKGTINVKTDNTPPKIVEKYIDTLNCFHPKIDIGVKIDRKSLEYLWNGPEIIDLKGDSLLKIGKPGKYFLQVTGDNHCVANVDFDVVLGIQPPEYSTFTDTLSCENAKTDIGVIPVSNIVSYAWSGPDNFTSNVVVPKISLPGTYTVTVTGSNGCPAVSEIVVPGEFSKPVVLLSDTLFLPCDSSSIFLQVKADKAIERVKWVFPGNVINHTISPPTQITGLYSVQVIGKNGCPSVTKKFHVAVSTQKPEYTVISDTINCLQSQAILNGKGKNSPSFTWLSPLGNIYQGGQLTTAESGTFTVYVVDNQGCRDTTKAIVLRDTLLPVLAIEQKGALQCENKRVILDGRNSTNGNHFRASWTTTNGNIETRYSDYHISLDKEGDYRFKLTNTISGCESSRNIRIDKTNQAFTQVNVSSDPPTCKDASNGSIRISGLNGTPPYSITLNGKAQNVLEYFNLDAGNYDFVFKDSLGCKMERKVVINGGTDLEITLDKEYSIKFGDSLLLKPGINIDPTGKAKLNWYKNEAVICADCPEHTVRPFINTIYNLVYSINEFCKKTTSVLIRVDNDLVNAIPNIFAPDKSGANSIYYIPQIRGIEKINFVKIFDRWGENVYLAYDLEPGDASKGWDGKFNGNAVMPGVLLVHAEMILSDGSVFSFRGDLTLVR
jgi:gliding motility-associated-like protein